MGGITAINDCSKLAANKAEFVAHVDLDEFIIPLKAEKITDFLEAEMRENPKYATFVFRGSNLHMSGNLYYFLNRQKKHKKFMFSAKRCATRWSRQPNKAYKC